MAQNALRVVEQAIGAPLKPRKIVQFPPHKKNAAAVALGKLGGMKGGRARAAKLSPDERKAIAQKAAKARWAKPAIKASAASAAVVETELDPGEKKKKREDEDEDRRHPLIEGLLKELPKPQAEWTTEDRKKWLEMASTIFNVIYKDSDDSRGSLNVVVERNSAK